MIAAYLRKTSGTELRKRAELLLTRTRQDIQAMSVAEVQELVHELQVHQIELQMQNEALHQAQDEIESLERKYRDLYDQAPVAYLTLTRDGIITEANYVAATLLDCPRESLINRKFSDFISFECQDIWYAHSRSVFREGERKTCQLENLNHHAPHLHVNSHAMSENAEYCRTTLTDVTTMKKMEGRLQKMREDAEAANAAKSQFLANTSHEVRTPLNAIIGLGGLLDMTALTEQQQKYVSTLRMSADSLLNLINELLDFSKIESGEIELESRPFSLSTLMGDTLKIIDIAAQERGLNVISECDPALPDHYLGDAHRLGQVLLNLLSNAIKFTHEGSVTLRIGGDVLGQDRVSLEIEVVDTGIGIPKDKRQKIFESFTQADASTTRKFGGTGLGLAISKRLVEYMGGEISLSSAVGVGSVFTVRLPLQTSSIVTAPGPATDALDSAPSTAHILVVEDYEPNVLVITNYLEEFGYTYDVAHNGREALRKFHTGSYAVILMDVQMQELDGYEATAEIRAIEQRSNLPPTPIIAMTAHALPQDRQRCLNAGMDDHISKPFDTKQLREKLAGLVRSH